MHLSQFERANVLNEESLAIYKELGDKQGIARGLHIKGGLAIDRVGDTSVLLEAVSLLSEVGDDLGLAFTYVYLGRYEATFNNYDEALAYHYKGEQLFRKLGHIAGIADTVATIGLVAVWQGDYETARTKLVESLELQETLGQRGSSISLQLLGQLHFRQGEYELARNLLERSLQIAIRAGKVNVADWSRAFLGHVYLNLAEFGRAWETFEEAKIHFFNAETLIGVVFVLEGVARLAVIKNHPQTAARLIGWADATRDAIENFRPPAEQQDVDRDKAEILELLGEEAFVRAYAAGKEMTVEEAMSLARPQ
jgi:tetratricopeptide (TPR) repeat protein